MEISAIYSNLSPFSIPMSQSFSDQSHLLFYSSSLMRIKTLKLGLHTAAFLAPARRPHRSTWACNTCDAIISSDCTLSEQDLLKDLAELKAQAKQKRKQLKAYAKERKKTQKHRKAKAKRCSLSSSSSSSSSSESSDGECKAVHMKLLRGEHTQLRAEQDSYDRTGLARANCQENAIAGKIEVCMGGKCKRAGSEKLLSSLRGQIPGNACVEAAPCKCMGRCGMAINVKVHHSQMRFDDAHLILSHHFGLGSALSALEGYLVAAENQTTLQGPPPLASTMPPLF